MGRSLILLGLNEPVLLNRGSLAASGLALNLNLLALVGGQLAGEVGLLGGLGSLGGSELLDVGLGVTGLDGGGLVGLQLAKVELLNGVRCSMCQCSRKKRMGFDIRIGKKGPMSVIELE